MSLNKRSHDLLVIFRKYEISKSIWRIAFWLFDFLDQVDVERIYG